MPLTMVVLIAIVAVLIVFWFWMFYEMANNDDIPSAAPHNLAWPPQAKSHWIIFFVILNVFTAGYYYFTVYRK